MEAIKLDNDHFNDLILPWTESKAKKEIRKKIFERAKKNREKMKKEMIKSIKIDEETDNEYICYDYEDCRLEQLIDKPNNRKIYDDLVNEVFEHLVIKKHNLNITSEVGMIKKIYKFYYKDIFVGIIGIKDYERTFGVKIKKEFQNTGIAKVALDFTLSVLNVNYIYGYVLNNNRNIIFFNTILSPILFDANKEYSKTRYMRFAI